MQQSLTPVVSVDEEKCVNCHMCISVCPVKYCIDGSGDHVTINHDLCIGCGSCIDACSHDARHPRDDFPDFLAAADRHEKLVAIAAPAVAAAFPDQQLNLNGFLASLGVEAVFDVSFGAELTVKSYLHHIESAGPDLVIAQPCPAIVTYIEIYQPELIPYLAPADSPMLHTIKLIREYHPAYAGHKVVIVSPCIAKRREFDETGLGDYNVTILSLKNHLAASSIDLAAFAQVDYTTPLPERAVLFSTPGGLKQTVEREVPGIGSAIRKIEGPRIIYDYLEKLPEMRERKMNPLVVDCLNCDMGCNGGTGTGNQDKSPDEVEYHVERRKAAIQQQHAKRSIGKPNYRRKVNRVLSRYWKPGLYGRTYRNLSDNHSIRRPDTEQFQEIYQRMLKTDPRDHLNCASCGYNSCEAMAIAIHNGLNKPENCHHYKQKMIELDHESYVQVSEMLHEEIGNCRALVETISSTIVSVNDRSHDQYASLEESSASVTEMIAAIGSASRVAMERRSAVSTLVDAARHGSDALRRTVSGVETIARSVDSIKEMIGVITAVAAQTNLLSMNAAIEAAHAGDAGRGFSVVAAEIRKLADTTAGHVGSISSTLNGIIGEINEVARVSNDTDQIIGKVISEIAEVADSLTMLANSMDEMSTGSDEITSALTNLQEISYDVKEKNGRITEIIGSVYDGFTTLADISSRNVDRMGARPGSGAPHPATGE